MLIEGVERTELAMAQEHSYVHPFHARSVAHVGTEPDPPSWYASIRSRVCDDVIGVGNAVDLVARNTGRTRPRLEV